MNISPNHTNVKLIDQTLGNSKKLIKLVLLSLLLLQLTGCRDTDKNPPNPNSQPNAGTLPALCKGNLVKAEVVALEQIITFNRFGAFNPAGMVYALRKDVVKDEMVKGKEINLADLSDDDLPKLAGRVKLREGKRPRPLVLRVHEEECLQVKFWNLLSPDPEVHDLFQRADFPKGGIQRKAMIVVDADNPKNNLEPKADDISTPPRNDPNAINKFPFPQQQEPDYPYTRSASIHVNGLDYANIESDGANVGKNPSSLVNPGQSTTYTWYGRQEGGYFMYSAGALAGGEGDGGQLGLGLFGSVNVEPKGSLWYRSQVTHDEIKAAAKNTDYSKIDFEKLMIVENGIIEHSDLNAIIYQTDKTGETPEVCAKRSPGSSCGMSFREFTTIFHDENKVFQAFKELADENNPLSAIADGMAINYGSSGVGSAVLAKMKKIGPGKDCPECKLEEYFLSSWVNGDPAMIVRRNMDGKAEQALYPDDPSNVHHSYLGDPVRFRNIHAGPKETHVFHLHAHQWLQDKNDPNANYLDSQTISPGSSYTYDIQYGGGGNRNLTVGDAIFHCHLYPHFAAGMWELWRNHDVFEDGMPGYFNKERFAQDRKAGIVSPNNDPRMRNLPDHEILGGTPNPALVPIPGYPLAPLPTAEMRGYPFFIAGEAGHRPPQPPLDMARDDKDQSIELNGGLPRHVIAEGGLKPSSDKHLQPEALLKGRGDPDASKASRYIAERTWHLNSDPYNLALAQELEWAKVKLVPQCGSKDEILAMAYHAGWSEENLTDLKKGKNSAKLMPDWCTEEVKHTLADLDDNFTWPQSTAKETSWPNRTETGKPLSPLWKGKGYDNHVVNHPSSEEKATKVYDSGKLFRVNGYNPRQGAPFAEPCPSSYNEGKTADNSKPFKVNQDNPRLYKTAYIEFDMTVNKYGWHDPQARMPVLEQDAVSTIDGTRLAEPLFFRANSGDCIQFQATNLIPGILNLDDFQVYTPTDTIGQHIHLVKFDVTSSDGSANGWNYEDGTFAPDEVRERIHASNYKSVEANKKETNQVLPDRQDGSVVDAHNNPQPKLFPKTHPIFAAGGSFSAKAERGTCADPDDESGLHPWCGAQTTVQRWWADPVLNNLWEDRTMRAVFTHDHYGPSSHQQHGFYAALVVEPKETVWTSLTASPADIDSTQDCNLTLLGGALPKPCRTDGGPTSYSANIGYPKNYPPEKLKEHKDDIRREYNLAFADFAILYNVDMRPVNPPSRQADLNLPSAVRDGLKPKPEGISSEDPGTRLLNYRNEPIPLRIAEEDQNSLQYHQKKDKEDNVRIDGDMAQVFSSVTHSKGFNFQETATKRFEKLSELVANEIIDNKRLSGLIAKQRNNTVAFNKLIKQEEPWRNDGDPSTPILAAYIGDPLKLHLIQGAQEEQHVFSMTGMKWLAEPKSLNSGYMNGQQIGISEHFEFDLPVPSVGTKQMDYWYGSPAVENMWDGMWGLLRSFGFDKNSTPDKPHLLELTALKKIPETETPPMISAGLGTCPSKSMLPEAHRKEFFVGAWLASDLLSDEGTNRYLHYNKRFNIEDRNAIVYVEQDLDWFKNPIKPDKILTNLRERYKKEKIEPLILRVHAGDCVTLHVANYLPGDMKTLDGPSAPQSWSYNLMPPIVSGFNFNEVQTSSRVDLQTQLLGFNQRTESSAAIGMNNCKTVNIAENPSNKQVQLNCENPIDDAPISTPKPCRKSQSLAFSDCQIVEIKWYAGDIKITKDRQSTESLNTEEAEADLPEDQESISEDTFNQALAFDMPKNENGTIVGWKRFTPIEFGAVSIRDFGDVIKRSSHGGIGALVVEPRDAKWQRSELALGENASALIKLANGESYREFVLLMQDDLSLRQNNQAMPNHRMADDAEDTGQKGFNYRSEPLWARNGLGTSGSDFNLLNSVDYTNTLSSHHNIASCKDSNCDPETPVFHAKPGEKLRFRIVHPGGHSRQHAFVLHGHNWDYQPWIQDSTKLWDGEGVIANKPLTARVGAIGGIGPGRHLNVLVDAGGIAHVPGDYLFRVQEQFQFQGGMWGILRVEKN
jgi:manganese oxidase